MSTTAVQADQRFVLYGEPWAAYVRLLHIFEERRHLRITFDRGVLEIMTLSPEHESLKHLVGRWVAVLTEELRLPLAAYGSMTFKRPKRRGMEADECFWIQNEIHVRGMQSFDPDRDPPPDLAVEVDVSRSSINRMAIYRAMRVPEVWRVDSRGIRFHVLGPDGKFTVSERSRAFPGLASTDLQPFLALHGRDDVTTIVQQFRAWVRQHLEGSGSGQP